MKISMMSYTMARGVPAGEFDARQLCEFTLELGLEGVDWVSTYQYEPSEIRVLMDDHGLKTVAHTFFCDLNFPTSEERADGRDTFKRGIDAAVALGTDIVMLPVGGKEELSRDQSRDNYLSGLEEVIEFADDAGVTVTIENFPSRHSPFITSADMNSSVKRIPQLRVTYDNGNVATGGETGPEGFTNSAPYIVHAHFKDWKQCDPDSPGARLFLDGKYRRAELVGDGDVDQIGCLRAMHQYGYTGYINFEYEGSELSPHDATVEGVRRLQKWISLVEQETV
jgi:sugar phosphate isomerase/epimerase